MNGAEKSKVAAVVLAAGMSRRMGTPKQLMQIHGKTILEHTLHNVRASAVGEIVLVLGYAAEDVLKAVPVDGLKVVRNQDYEQGMGTSLRSGLAAVDGEASAALIVLADQPFIKPDTINQLITCHQQAKPQIIIPVHNGFRGNPVLLDRSVFPELQNLSGDVGCRTIFGSHTENIRKLAVNDIGILLDIDNQEEYKKLEKKFAACQSISTRASDEVLDSRAVHTDGPELIIAGRDDVAQALTKFGKMLNFTVTVIDPLLALEDWPEADRVLHVLDFSQLPPTSDRYVVAASRGLFDEEAIEQALQTQAAYIGLLANRKRADEIKRSLRAKAISEEKLITLHAPAGLSIGAESPEEIALSIMGEIVGVRRKK